MNQLNLFTYLARKKITPNEYAALFNIHNKATINKGLEVNYDYLRMLGFIIKEDGKWIITKAGTGVINQVDSYFAEPLNIKVAKRLDTESINTLTEALLKLYPVKTLDEKKRRLRDNKIDVSFKLRKFFTKYSEYDFELVFDATVEYLEEGEEQNYTWTKSISNYISKDNISELAKWCEILYNRNKNKNE